MNATAPAQEPVRLDPVYPLRDDLAKSQNPANAFERLLVTAIAQAWLRLQEAHELERRVFAKTDPLDLFSGNLAAFKALTRHVDTCERAWRRSIQELHRAQRNRAQPAPGSPRPHPVSTTRQHQTTNGAGQSIEIPVEIASAPKPQAVPYTPL